MYGTIYNEQTGTWLKGSNKGMLKGKWVNEQPAVVFRTRGMLLAEAGSPALVEAERGSLVTGFLLGLVASYVANYLYDKSKRRRR